MSFRPVQCRRDGQIRNIFLCRFAKGAAWRAFEGLSCGALLALALAAGAGAADARERLAGPVVGTVQRVIDGDTLVVEVPVWLGLAVTTSVRLKGIDTPELRGRLPAGEGPGAAGEGSGSPRRRRRR